MDRKLNLLPTCRAITPPSECHPTRKSNGKYRLTQGSALGIRDNPRLGETVASEHWKDEPEQQDFPAAESYLSLLVGADTAAKLAKALRKKQPLRHYAAKDILRAAGLPLLGQDDSEVTADLKKVKSGKKLSPVLLVYGTPLWVADGYHRICSSYHIDEKAQVPCRIVARPS